MLVDPATIGKAIKTMRKHLGYSQRALQDASGVSRTSIHLIENGESRYPTLDTVVKLMEAMGVRLEYRIRIPALEQDMLSIRVEKQIEDHEELIEAPEDELADHEVEDNTDEELL